MKWAIRDLLNPVVTRSMIFGANPFDIEYILKKIDGIKGSCFEVSIPLGNSHLQPGEILEEEDKKEQEITKKKVQANRNFNILIVDDDSEIAQYIKTELSDWYRFERAGYKAMGIYAADIVK